MVGAFATALVHGQKTAAPAYVPKQSDRPRPLTGEEPGFQPFFNGKTLEG
jgi:hypothetical protein